MNFYANRTPQVFVYISPNGIIFYVRVFRKETTMLYSAQRFGEYYLMSFYLFQLFAFSGGGTFRLQSPIVIESHIRKLEWYSQESAQKK